MKTLVVVVPGTYKKITESSYQKAIRLLVEQLGTINIEENESMSENHTAIFYNCTFNKETQQKLNDKMHELDFIALFIEVTEEDEQSKNNNYSLCFLS